MSSKVAPPRNALTSAASSVTPPTKKLITAISRSPIRPRSQSPLRNRTAPTQRRSNAIIGLLTLPVAAVTDCPSIETGYGRDPSEPGSRRSAPRLGARGGAAVGHGRTLRVRSDVELEDLDRQVE